MAYLAAEIARREAALAELKADDAAENMVLNASRPAGIPAAWRPIPFRRGLADWLLVAWVHPDFEVSAHPLAGLGKPPIPGPPAGPPGPP